MTEPIAVIGIDPGSRWTAAVLRIDDTPVYGWTLGPLNIAGALDAAALDNPRSEGYYEALSRTLERLIGAVGDLEARAQRITGERPWIGVETVTIPHLGGRIRLAAWLVTRDIVVGLMGARPTAAIVDPAKAGPAAHYPAALVGKPRADWGPVESYRRERDHERAAWDVTEALMGALTGAEVTS